MRKFLGHIHSFITSPDRLCLFLPASQSPERRHRARGEAGLKQQRKAMSPEWQSRKTEETKTSEPSWSHASTLDRSPDFTVK